MGVFICRRFLSAHHIMWSEEEEVREPASGTPLERGCVRAYGAGLDGCTAGDMLEFYVEVNKEDLPYPAEPENCKDIQVTLTPSVQRLRLLGRGRKVPEAVSASIELVPAAISSGNFQYFVSCCCTFAAPYQVIIEVPGTDISLTLPAVHVRPGPPHPAGCTVKGTGSTGGVSRMPASFRVLIADVLGNPVKPDDLPDDEQPKVDVSFEPISINNLDSADLSEKIQHSMHRHPEDGSHVVTFVAPWSGTSLMLLTLDGEPIEGSPFLLTIVPGLEEMDEVRLSRKRTQQEKRIQEEEDELDGLPSMPLKELFVTTGADIQGPERTCEEDIILLQSVFRCFLAKRKLKMLDQINRKRWMLMQEVIRTEETYISNLERLVNFYMIPIKNQRLMNEKQMLKAFSNVEFISETNQQLISALQNRTNGNYWVLFGDVFSTYAPQLKSCYSIYINNYNDAINTLTQLDDNRPLQTFIESVSEARGTDLMSLMIGPVQRLPRYELFLREMLKYTDLESPDYVNIEQALQDMLGVNRYINEEKRRAERLHHIFRIARKMYGMPPGFTFFEAVDLNSAKRDYYGQGPLTVIHKGKSAIRQVIVFTDSLILAAKRISPARGSKNLAFKALLRFGAISVQFSAQNMIKIMDSRGYCVILKVIDSSAESLSWLTFVKKAIVKYQTSK